MKEEKFHYKDVVVQKISDLENKVKELENKIRFLELKPVVYGRNGPYSKKKLKLYGTGGESIKKPYPFDLH